MQLTGWRRRAQTVLLLSVAWAGALAFVLSWQDGYVIHHIWGSPTRYWRYLRPAGASLSRVVGVMAMLALLVALRRPTARITTYTMLVLFALAPLCCIESFAFDDLRVESWDGDYLDVIEVRWAAIVVHDAIVFIGWSSVALSPLLALLHTLERRARPRLPSAQVIS